MHFKAAELYADAQLDELLPADQLLRRFSIESFGGEIQRLGFSMRGLERFAKRLRTRFGRSIVAAERPIWRRSFKVFRLRIITTQELRFEREGSEPYPERCALITEALFIWRRGEGWQWARYDTGSIGRHCMARTIERGLPADFQDNQARRYLRETLKQISRDLTEAVHVYGNAVSRGYDGKEVLLPLHGGIVLGTHTNAESGVSSRPGALKGVVRLDLRTFCHSSLLTERQNEGFLVIHDAVRRLRAHQYSQNVEGGIDAIVDPVLYYYLAVRGQQSPWLATRSQPLPEAAPSQARPDSPGRATAAE